MLLVSSGVYLDQARVVEHVLPSALNDWGITGYEAVGRQHLQSVASQGNIASEGETD